MRKTVSAAATRPAGMQIRGSRRPTSTPPGIPPRLAALLAQSGEGLLCGELWLRVPGSDAHVAMVARFERELARRADTLAWLPLRSRHAASWIVLGEATAQRGFLIWAPLDPSWPELQLAEPYGTFDWIARDLDDLVESLVAGELYRRLLTQKIGSYVPCKPEHPDPRLFLADTLAAEIVARDVPRVYDTDAGDVEAAFRASLQAGDATSALEALLAAYPVPTGLLAAGQILASSGANANDEVRETVRAGLARHRVCVELADLATGPAPTVTLQAFRELGLAGTDAPDDDLLVAWKGSPVKLGELRDGIAAARAALPENLFARFSDALARVSPYDAVLGASPQTYAKRAWPLLFLHAWSDGSVGDPVSCRDPLVGELLDHFLLVFAESIGKDLVEGAQLRVFHDVELAARARVRRIPIDDEELAQLCARARAHAGDPWWYHPGLWGLLATCAERDGTLAVFEAHARAQAGSDVDASPYLMAAETAGRGHEGAFGLLALIYTQPRRFSSDSRLEACELAVRLGDHEARAVVDKLNQQLHREVARKGID